jgi:protein O-GlcNAc transferase
MSGNLDAARDLFTQAAQRLLRDDFAGAETQLRAALDLAPGRPSIMVNLAAALIAQEKYAEAKTLAAQVTAAEPGNAQAWLNLGRCQEYEKRYADALNAYDRALACQPDYAEVWCSRGNVHKARQEFDQARAAYDRAIELQPNLAEALGNQAMLYLRLDRPAEAVPMIARAIAAKPALPYGYSIRMHAKAALCDWSSYADDCAALKDSVATGRGSVLPFTFIALPADAALQKQCSMAYAASKYPAAGSARPATAPRETEKLRIGYFSADLQEHAVGHLVAGLFEQHDRDGFEIHAFSFGAPTNDAMRRRLRAGVDHFHDVYASSDAETCELARGLNIDIAVDLTGYTRNERTGIFARRTAPLQVNWLGFPGTLGAPFMDYIIADATIVPSGHFPHYSESVVHLPQTYQSTDNRRKIADRAFSRAELGLPETGFVFCSFNNNYKITPDIFDIWMRLLQAVPGSVLWLMETSHGISGMLRNEAEQRGVAPERLVFARRMEQAEHLARHRLADLFLDTFHYNAHTTASDALWAGLPVLTRIGNTFASRVAASLLRAANLPDLVTQSTEEYEALALALSRDPARLQALRQRLAATRDSCPLFDTPRFTRGLEAAYRAMWDRHLAGLPPAHIAINETSPRNIALS